MRSRIIAAFAVVGVLFGGSALLPASAAPTAGTGSVATPCDNDPNNCVDPSCIVDPGNPTGVCWYEGHQFYNRTICIESTLPNPTLALQTLQWVSDQWSVNGPRIYVRNWTGGCAAAGFGPYQIVKFEGYSADDGHCGLSYSKYLGYPENKVTINMHPTVVGGFQYAALCRSGARWNIVHAHEMGHQLGLTHYAESESLMQFGTYRSAVDAWKMSNLYTNNPCGDPTWPGCV
jgi:hypothetical protein